MGAARRPRANLQEEGLRTPGRARWAILCDDPAVEQSCPIDERTFEELRSLKAWRNKLGMLPLLLVVIGRFGLSHESAAMVLLEVPDDRVAEVREQMGPSTHASHPEVALCYEADLVLGFDLWREDVRPCVVVGEQRWTPSKAELLAVVGCPPERLERPWYHYVAPGWIVFVLVAIPVLVFVIRLERAEGRAKALLLEDPRFSVVMRQLRGGPTRDQVARAQTARAQLEHNGVPPEISQSAIDLFMR